MRGSVSSVADISELSEEAQRWVGEMEAWRTAELHPDLKPYVHEGGPIGTVLQHPLVYEIPHMLPGRCNEAYAHKQRELKKAIALRKWDTVIWLHERPWRLDALMALREFEIPNKRWWQLVRQVWVDSENVYQNGAEWERVWADTRPNRQAVMDKDEKAELRALPDTLTVYRGAIEEMNAEGMSWTLEPKRAEWFAHRFERGGTPVVIEARVAKAEVLAHFTGRNESEIVLPLDAVRTQSRVRVVRVREVAVDGD